MNSSKTELCCNPLCQLYDPMSAISFMRECISEPMKPGDEGMTHGSSILAYLVFRPGRTSTEGMARPTKMIA
jgi:hypothetical protein